MHQVGIGAEAIEEELVFSSCNRRRKRSIAFARDDHFSPAMLPLVSTTMPRLTGVALGAEVRDLDRLVVLVDDEVFLAQAGTKRPDAIGDRGGDVDQLDAALEPEALLLLRRRWRGADAPIAASRSRSPRLLFVS